MPVSQFNLGSPRRHVIAAVAMILLVGGVGKVVLWAFANTLAINSDALQSDSLQATQFAAAISPSDPLARSRYARELEKTFDLTSIDRSLGEYEAAIAAAPYSFGYWLALGQARERDGNRAGAEIAYRRAIELAPNYARTRWALGNNLVRQGKVDEGIDLIRQAVDQDADFAAPAITAALLAFDGDIARVGAAIGSSPTATVELAKYLANAGRFDEAMSVWSSLKPENFSLLRDAATSLRQKFVDAKRFRNAVQITSALEANADRRSTVGAISNGSFEAGVATQNVDLLDWKIGLTYPIFGLSDQAKDGKYSLLIRFTTPARSEFDPVSRLVAVEPDATYDLSFWYRNELSTRAEFRWEAIAPDGKRIAVTDPLAPQSNWTEARSRVTVPLDIDGITLRLIREKCDSVACTVAGNLWFDDFKMTKADRP